MEPEQGCYPRLNSTSLRNPESHNMIVSVIGSMEACDGENLTLKTADGGTIRVGEIDGNLDFQQGQIIEVIGLNHGSHVQFFVKREISQDFDLQLYNDLITKILPNPAFREYFAYM